MTTFHIAVILGDGIGKEVVPEGIQVLDAAGRRFGCQLDWQTFDWSCETYLKTGRIMPDDGLKQVRAVDAIYLGAVGRPDLKITLLASLPYLAGFVVQQLNGWHSDRARERRWHTAAPVLLSGVFLFLSIQLGSSLALSTFFFTLVGGAYYGFHPAFWAVPTEFLSESAAAAAIGLINSVGNLGGFVGPFIIGYLLTRSHSFTVGLWYMVGSFFCLGFLCLRSAENDPSGLKVKAPCFKHLVNLRVRYRRSTLQEIEITSLACLLYMLHK